MQPAFRGLKVGFAQTGDLESAAGCQTDPVNGAEAGSQVPEDLSAPRLDDSSGRWGARSTPACIGHMVHVPGL